MVRKYVFGRQFQCVLNTKRERSGDNISNMSLKKNYGVEDVSKATRADVFRPGTKYSEAIGRFPSIFQAEIHAIEVCVRENLYRGYIGQGITVMSDSQALGVPAETELAWEKQQRGPPLGNWTHWCRGNEKADQDLFLPWRCFFQGKTKNIYCKHERQTLEVYRRLKAGYGAHGRLKLKKVQSVHRTQQNQTSEINRLSYGALPAGEALKKS